ncbi:hypothetical protein ABID47_001477 [Paenibacillus favisporus]|uniref:Uncharacterized protein n=1 Tax=Paenibacillus favisporus TaxID=221028 RepID=A0ABV2EZD8_9BACL
MTEVGRETNSFYRMFQLTETGFEFISILLIVTIIVGFIVAVLFFRHNLTGKKIMIIGGELILLGLVFNLIVDFKFRFPSLSFIVILLGTITCFIGLCRKD